MNRKLLLTIALLLAAGLAGCVGPYYGDYAPYPTSYAGPYDGIYAPLPYSGIHRFYGYGHFTHHQVIHHHPAFAPVYKPFRHPHRATIDRHLPGRWQHDQHPARRVAPSRRHGFERGLANDRHPHKRLETPNRSWSQPQQHDRRHGDHHRFESADRHRDGHGRHVPELQCRGRRC